MLKSSSTSVSDSWGWRWEEASLQLQYQLDAGWCGILCVHTQVQKWSTLPAWLACVNPKFCGSVSSFCVLCTKANLPSSSFINMSSLCEWSSPWPWCERQPQDQVGKAASWQAASSALPLGRSQHVLWPEVRWATLLESESTCVPSSHRARGPLLLPIEALICLNRC